MLMRSYLYSGVTVMYSKGFIMELAIFGGHNATQSERQITVREKRNMSNPGIVLQGRPGMISTPAIVNIQWYTIAEGRMWWSLHD